MQLNRIHVVTVCLYKHKKIQRRAEISSFGSLASTMSHSASVWGSNWSFYLKATLPVTIVDTITASKCTESSTRLYFFSFHRYKFTQIVMHWHVFFFFLFFFFFFKLESKVTDKQVI